MYERFTDRARKVMAFAQQEAHRLNHEYVGTEHILLGLIKEGSGVGANVLKNLGVDLYQAKVCVYRLVKAGPEMVTMGNLPQTPQAKKLIEEAISSARDLHHNYVGTEHILLGILRIDPLCVASTVLRNLGVEIEQVKSGILDLLGVSEEEKSKVAPMNESDKVYCLMMRGHAGQKRSNGEPYYTHPVAVRDLLKRVGIADIVVLNTALLHDLLEDTKITEDEIRAIAGEEVLVAVKHLTNLPANPNDKWDFATKHSNMLAHAKNYDDVAKRVKLADRYSNLCDAIWDWQPHRVKRYAKAGLELIEAMQPLPDDVDALEKEAIRFFNCLI